MAVANTLGNFIKSLDQSTKMIVLQHHFDWTESNPQIVNKDEFLTYIISNVTGDDLDKIFTAHSNFLSTTQVYIDPKTVLLESINTGTLDLKGLDARLCIEMTLCDPAFSPTFMNNYNMHLNKLNGINDGNFNEANAIKLANKTVKILMIRGQLGDFNLNLIKL